MFQNKFLLIGIFLFLFYSCSHKKVKEPQFVIEFGNEYELLPPLPKNDILTKCDEGKNCRLNKGSVSL